MASAAGSTGSRAAWMFRALALGSSAAVAIHLSPIVLSATAPHSVTLCGCSEPFLARTGLSRVTRQARSSGGGRRALLAAGVLDALEGCCGSEDEGVRKVLRESGVCCEDNADAVDEGSE